MALQPTATDPRTHYMNLVKEKGIDDAITILHNDLGRLEPETFTGGFNKERFDHVQALRLLSRELWNIKLRQATEKAYGADEARKTFGNNYGKIS